MPREKQAVIGEVSLPDLPVNGVVAREGASRGSTSGRSDGQAASEVFSRQALLDMQAERDLAPSLMGEEWDEEDEGFIPLRKLGDRIYHYLPR